MAKLSESVEFGGEHTTVLLDDTAFCISGPNGDVGEDDPGFINYDMRFLSRWELQVDGKPLDPVTTVMEAPHAATFVSRERPRHAAADSTLVVTRRRVVGQGMREAITIHNFDHRARTCLVELTIDDDFADLFEVKRGRSKHDQWGTFDYAADGNRLQITYRKGTLDRGVDIVFDPRPELAPRLARWSLDLAPQGSISIEIEVRCRLDGELVELTHHLDEPIDESAGARRHAKWRAEGASIHTGYAPLATATDRSIGDLATLLILDGDHPDRNIVAAGAPWYMTFFGRDSILTSMMSMLVNPRLGLGTAQTLARFQGTEYDPATEEQPGRMVHEIRVGAATTPALKHGDAYYGTVDATPLFVMLLGELYRWGLPHDELSPLLPAADRALEWIDRDGDLDGDGFVEYRSSTPERLTNQGWKDSYDGITNADGTMATAPIALCEVQGYVYAAWSARADIAELHGDAETASRLRERAAELKRCFNETFWLDDRGAIAVALDGDKQPVDSITSNMGHCLWTGIVDDVHAKAVADWLVSDDMFTGWGVRTLAASMGAYNPVSYHNGSVWPHDTAICVAGLLRYGFVDEAHRILLGLLDLADRSGGRLPEVVAGVDRKAIGAPIPYPNSCSPQAWAAAAPLLITRALLGFEPDLPNGVLRVEPKLPAEIAHLHVANVALGRHRVAVTVDASGLLMVDGLPGGLELNPSR